MPQLTVQQEQEQHDAELAAGFAAASSRARDTDNRTEDDPDPEITTNKAPPQGDADDSFRRLEERHRALEGKYRAEVPRLAEENRRLKAELEQVRSNPKPATPAETGKQPEAPPPEVVAFKEEFPTHAQVIDYEARKAAESVVEAERQRLQQEIEAERAARVELARQLHFQTIEKEHRDWQDLLPDINAWAATLGDPDEQARASQILERGNANDVVDLYSRFKRETGRAAQRQEPAPTGLRPTEGFVVPGMPGDDANDLAAGFRLSKQLRAQR